MRFSTQSGGYYELVTVEEPHTLTCKHTGKKRTGSLLADPEVGKPVKFLYSGGLLTTSPGMEVWP